jgi:uncharacterized protein YciI
MNSRPGDPGARPAGEAPAPAAVTAPARAAADRSALLGHDYWLVRSTPLPGTTGADIARHADDHIAWLLKLEADGVVFLSGPLTSGPGVAPGAGVTVLRADSAADAAAIAAADPFVLAGLRTFEVFGWRVNEGAVAVQLSLGTGRYTWG